MKLSTLIVHALLGVTQQAPSPGVNLAAGSVKKFPLYPNTESAPATYAQAKTTYTADLGGYKCLRNDLIYAVPQSVATTQVTVSGTLRSFYGTATAMNGTPGIDSDCCIARTTKTDCESVFSAGTTVVVGRVAI